MSMTGPRIGTTATRTLAQEYGEVVVALRNCGLDCRVVDVDGGAAAELVIRTERWAVVATDRDGDLYDWAGHQRYNRGWMVTAQSATSRSARYLESRASTIDALLRLVRSAITS